VVTGAADDESSSIVTYSRQGAALGHSILWTVVLTYPLMVAIQIAADLIAMGAVRSIWSSSPQPGSIQRGWRYFH
jgi:Mn2+/Fe2+ NRAMP family transporter